MLVLVTRNQQKHTPLLQWLTQHGIYTWVTSPDAAQAIICEKDTGGVILDTPGNLSTMEALCRTLRESYPPMPIAAIVAKEAIPNMQVNRILREGREGISREDVLEFATVNCAWHAEHLSSPYLFVGNAPEETLYMGYRLHLSPAEHILLRCLFYRYPTPTASADLLMLCYPCKTERRENLAVLIGRINRRAQEIDPHPLIVPLQGKGYVLRRGIVSTTIERTPLPL